MAPVRDWHLVSRLVSMLNTNDPSSLFSVNNPDPAAWEALLDGMIAWTNDIRDLALPFSTTPHFSPIVISSNSTQAAFIADAGSGPQFYRSVRLQ